MITRLLFNHKQETSTRLILCDYVNINTKHFTSEARTQFIKHQQKMQQQQKLQEQTALHELPTPTAAR
jgi:hypothetical protein